MYSSSQGIKMSTDRTYITPKTIGLSGSPALSNELRNPEDSKRMRDILSSIQTQCLSKGLGGVRGLCVLFRGMDRDYSKTLTLEEITDGLKQYRILLKNPDDIKFVYNSFDRDSSGAIDFKEFLVALMPPMPSCRVKVVLEAFDKLDYNKDGALQEEDLMVTYKSHAENHPKYKSGDWTLEKVLKTFLSTFDSSQAPDGQVTREEFLQYYAGVSCTIDDNAYFDLMMRACWGLPARGGASTAPLSKKK